MTEHFDGLWTLMLAVFLAGCPFDMQDDYSLAPGGGDTPEGGETVAVDAIHPSEDGGGSVPDAGMIDSSLAQVCTPSTCSALGADCGTIADGCGGAIDCGTCPLLQTCGASGPNKCGCAPQTCDQLGAECGMVDDGCGRAVSCGTCMGDRTCGSRRPNRCDRERGKGG